ncbi:MAG: MATE family efflux transporter [Defluviitaleaceae bacterium]|nr:MATE family efflux transporter [Defluviitaleaceae bacterium]
MTSSKAVSRYDMTQGDIFRKLLFISLPVMGGTFMQMAYTLADIFWLARLSTEAVVAASTAGMFLWMSLGLMLMVRIGTEIGVSQCVGKGDSDKARGYAQTGIWTALPLGVAFGAVMVIGRAPLVAFFDIPSEQVVRYAQNYLSISGFSVPFMYVSAVIGASFAGSGNTRLPFAVQSAGLLANIVLTPVLIFGADMGLEGAAYATIIARTIEITLFLLAAKFYPNRPFAKFPIFVRPNIQRLRDILRWGFPVAVETITFSLLSMLIARMVAQWGVEAMAAQRVTFQIESLSWLVGAGFGSAMTAFVGQNYGAGKWTRIHRGFKTAVLSMTLWGLAVSVYLLVFADHLIAIFLHDPVEIALGAALLRMLAVCQIPQAIEGAMAACFRGRGVTVKPSVVSVTCNVSRVILAYILNIYFGLFGIWWAIIIGACARGLWMLLWFMWDRRSLPTEDTVPDNSGLSHV